MNNKVSDTYFLSVLSEKTISYDNLQSVWKTDKRYPEASIQRFIRLNQKAFDFIGITAKGTYINERYVLVLTTSIYAGVITILSPKDGLPFGNILVKGRYGEDISELMSTIGEYVQPEFDESLKLKADNFVHAPLYMECMKYIDTYIKARQLKWHKFESAPIVQSQPSNSTQWEKYAERSYNPINHLRFPNKPNTLTTLHPEWLELQYVLCCAIQEIESSRTPLMVKTSYLGRISQLKQTISFKNLRSIAEIKAHSSDPAIIKELKHLANKILQNSNNSFCAWRIDYAEFYERYLLYIFKDLAMRRGAKLLYKPKYRISGAHPAWGLQYLEPDFILQDQGYHYVIDAKYKSHMYNVSSSSDIELKDTFRHDLHQVLAYASFTPQTHKNVIIAYPASHFICMQQSILSTLTGVSCNVKLMGIPLVKSMIEETKAHIMNALTAQISPLSEAQESFSSVL